MRISALEARLAQIKAKFGDVKVVCPGEHYGEYVYAGCSVEYKEKKEEYGFDVVDEDDIEYLNDPETVLVIA